MKFYLYWSNMSVGPISYPQMHIIYKQRNIFAITAGTGDDRSFRNLSLLFMYLLRPTSYLI